MPSNNSVFRETIRTAISTAIKSREISEYKMGYTSDSAYLYQLKVLLEDLEKANSIKIKD